jgi:hypothetical protein
VFEATIVADYDAQSAVERELVLRLASLLWRLRRATTIETGLLTSKQTIFGGQGSTTEFNQPLKQLVHALFEPRALVGDDEMPKCTELFAERTIDFARCFLRPSNLPNYALDRLSRYEATLGARLLTLIALDALDRRKPQDRRRPLRFSSLQELPNHDHGDG